MAESYEDTARQLKYMIARARIINDIMDSIRRAKAKTQIRRRVLSYQEATARLLSRRSPSGNSQARYATQNIRH